MGEHVQKARKLQLFFMEAITYQKKKKNHVGYVNIVLHQSRH